MNKAFVDAKTEQSPTNRLTANHSDANPQASFTNNQWYCHQARQTVFFTAFTTDIPDQARVMEIAAELAVLAPQLTTGFVGANPHEPLNENILSRITDVELVDDMTGYPEKWDLKGVEIFDTPDLPLFRVKAVVRRDGPDEQGRQAVILVLATHALLEGADSALLSRSRSVPRGAVTGKPNKTPLLHRLRYGATAACLVPLQMLAAYILAPRSLKISYRAVAIERSRIRRAAAALNVRQRSLMFALVAYALNKKGAGFSRRAISAIYADLDTVSDAQTNDDFFQFRMIDAKLKVHDDFPAFAREVDAVIASVEQKDMNATQSLLNAMFSMHRRLKSVLPFLYSPRFFRYAAGYHLTLSLVPPQRLGGDLTNQLMEPVFCGTQHPGINMAVFAPGRSYVTINMALHERLLSGVDGILLLLDEIDPITE